MTLTAQQLQRLLAHVATATVVRAGLPPRRSPRKNPAQLSNAPEVLKSNRGDSSFVPASRLFPPSKSNAAEKMEVHITTDAGGKQCTTEGGGHSE